MAISGYNEDDIFEMQKTLEYAIQDANDNGEEEQAESLMNIFNFFDEMNINGLFS